MRRATRTTYTPITKIEAAELRGFFWGEGCLRIDTNGRPNPMAQVLLRADDTEALEWIEERIGGAVMGPYDTDGSPHRVWRATKIEHLWRLVRALVNGSMPAKKARELGLFVSAIEVKSLEGEWPKQKIDDALHRIAKQLSAAKGYRQPAEIVEVPDAQLGLFPREEVVSDAS